MSKTIIDLGQVRPIKGQDYFTEAEIEEFVGDVATSIETSVNATYESTNNKVSEVSGSSTDDKYPSAKLVNNESKALDDRMDILNRNCQAFKSTMPNETAEGQAVNLQNCNPVPLNSFELKGVSDGTITGDNTVMIAGKNLLRTSLEILKERNTTGTWNGNVYTLNNVTFTVNDDLTINVNGTANAATSFILSQSGGLRLSKGVSYTMRGCPSGGGVTGYSIRVYNGTSYTSDTGSGIAFTYDDQGPIRLNVSNGTAVSNKLFQPMLTLTSATDTTYETPIIPQQVTLPLGDIELQENDIIHKLNFDWLLNNTKITDTTLLGQLEALEELPLFEGVNNITITTSNAQPIIKVNANKKWNLDTLEARITLLE